MFMFMFMGAIMARSPFYGHSIILLDSGALINEELVLVSRVLPDELMEIRWINSQHAIEEAKNDLYKIEQNHSEGNFPLIPYPLTAWVIDCRKVDPEILIQEDCPTFIFRAIGTGLIFLYETGSSIPEIIAKNSASTFLASRKRIKEYRNPLLVNLLNRLVKTNYRVNYHALNGGAW